VAIVQTPRPQSAKILEKALGRERGELTVADAAARGGLPLREAEEGLRYLAAEFGGHLAATDKGELLYSFPGGMVRPPETRWWRRGLAATGRAVMGIGRFIVRAWVSVVLVAYALAFLALLIALSLKSDRDDGPGEAIGVVLRVIAEALYWTFHPFSPVYLNREPGWMNPRRGRNRGPRVPFYEKVNRFVFGPRPPERDPLEDERNVLAELRRQSGRVSPADVMRVTGLPREAAERLMLRLVVDYQGDFEVADTGAIIYRFRDLRSTARMGESAAVPAPFWQTQSVLPPLTGNQAGSNLLFGAINGFNLLASIYALSSGLTLERIGDMIARAGERFPAPLPPPDGTPLVFGVIPFVFSTALFALPLLRTLRRPKERKRVGRENGWRGVLRLSITGRRGSVIQTKAEVEAAWIAAGGHPPTEAELTEAVRAAGGDVDVGEDGQVIYKFDQVEGELRASAEDRRAASATEMNPGEVVFSSADEGPGMRQERQGREGREEEPAPRGWAPPPSTRGEEPAAATRSPSTPAARPALPERGEEIPGGRISDTKKESVDELLSRIGVDTRRRGG
jgi:hypothetical protein